MPEATWGRSGRGSALSLQLRQKVSELQGRGAVLSSERLRTVAVEALQERITHQISVNEQHGIRQSRRNTAVL